ncbi:hypothetical protein EZV62_023893 [Acer yangbiense]|uniref:CCHC-type domain-containing protein n=1 Tax=Acer yangbiense TaxID=1000413 RepID=A0A5C7H3R2_9ROSI|nr:hypothetical protein EZV62_023893 [Acer yangbiense]
MEEGKAKGGDRRREENGRKRRDHLVEMDLAKLYQNLSIAEEDRAIHEISEEDKLDGVEDVDQCLVGKVLTDRNRVWFRGPWHFGNSLIALEKPVGTGSISQLMFNKTAFWIQIHEIPIMCMNRRTAKWMAEQIGEAVELPSESRECWGKFMRVKVRIDISKPLKRWLRLKLGKTEEVTMVSLKYERLPEFCFTCGRIGHSNKECQDEEAKEATLEETVSKYGSWLKAPIPDRTKIKGGVQVNVSSSDRLKPQENSQEVEGDGSVSLKFGIKSSLKQDGSAASTAASQPLMMVKRKGNLDTIEGNGPPGSIEMCIDGLGPGVEVSSTELGHPNNVQSQSPQLFLEGVANPSHLQPKILVQPILGPHTGDVKNLEQPMETEPPKSPPPPSAKTSKKMEESCPRINSEKSCWSNY